MNVTIQLDGLKKPVTVLVDSGADVSLLKYDNICKVDMINKTCARTKGGAFNGASRTLGEFNTNWKVKKINISTSWQVVNDMNNIPFDGILDRDILWQRSIINTWEKTLAILNSNGKILQIFPLIWPSTLQHNSLVRIANETRKPVIDFTHCTNEYSE